MDTMITGGNGFLGRSLRKRIPAFSVDLPNDISFSVPYIEGIKKIYNFAGFAAPTKYSLDPLGTWRSNVIGTLNVLSFAEQMGASVLQASTAAIGAIVDDYTASKRTAESLCKCKKNVRIVRMLNIFGPEMLPDDGRVIPTIMHQAMNGETIRVFGNALRSFLYIDDALDGIQQIMEGQPGLYYLYHPEQIRMGDLVQLICEITQSRSQILHIDTESYDHNLPTVESVIRPTVSLRDGLEKMMRGWNEKNALHPGHQGVAAPDH